MNIDIYIMVLQFLLGLSLIVGLHEFGHMFFAKLFGMRVEQYSIGFPPKILNFKFKDTEYSLGLIPLGGFVKISGMINESIDDLEGENNSWEFRFKAAWQRFLVIIGGVLFNIITGLVIYILISFYLGNTYIDKNEVNEYGVFPSFMGKKLGFLEGDKITHINGNNFNKFGDIMNLHTLLSSDTYYVINRLENSLLINIPINIMDYISNSKDIISFVQPLILFEVGVIKKNTGSYFSRLRKGDKIININGMNCLYFQNLLKILKNNLNKNVKIKYVRNNKLYSSFVKIDKHGKIGFRPYLLLFPRNKNYTFAESIYVGSKKVLDIFYFNFTGLFKIITCKVSVSKSLSGPVGIVKVFTVNFDWVNFWSITGFLSIALAFINMLPIPVLDGGHAVFILYEMIFKKKLSNNFLKISNKFGIFILFFLIFYTIINDIYKFL